MFRNMPHLTSQHGNHVPCGTHVHPGVYPQTSEQKPPNAATDVNSLRAQLQRERVLRENAERELHHLKVCCFDSF
ncbi:hypothetical protein GCK32_014344 [Trichostrongylus colubriformis]|uniref:Uncharacterized protein n=1 Tax=Trichostrongylus colubriformis TaxID=6319 RepID=A0AAN8FEW8_TRICO